MTVALTKTHFLVVAWSLITIFFVISLSGVVYSPLADWSARVANRNYNGEGLIETIEALCWLAATLIYAKVTAKIFRLTTERLPELFLLFFILFCFVAFGEEISWGQLIFNFEVPEYIKNINKQKELNIHNLNISQILGLSKDNFAFKYLRNFTTILNPLFYLLCILLWVIFPLIKKTTIWKNKFLSSLPEAAFGTIVFCGVNALIYLVVDKLFFDVGEIFELALALTALLSALDAYQKIEDRVVLSHVATMREKEGNEANCT